MYCILDWALHHTGLDSPSLSRLSVSDWLSLSNDHLPGLGPLRLSMWRTGGRLLLDNVSIYPGAGQLERLQSTHTLSLSLSLSLTAGGSIVQPGWRLHHSLPAGGGGVSGGVVRLGGRCGDTRSACTEARHWSQLCQFRGWWRADIRTYAATQTLTPPPPPPPHLHHRHQPPPPLPQLNPRTQHPSTDSY